MVRDLSPMPAVAATGIAVWRGTELVGKGELAAGIAITTLGLLIYAYVHKELPSD